MQLPVVPPVRPMLAKPVGGFDALPTGELVFEPKWDGFRCIVFRDGDEVVLGSRNDRPLTRYFPEMVEVVLRELPERCVVDGELVVASVDESGRRHLDFDALQLRIHPAVSRITMLAAEIPASFVAFDLLALGERDVRAEPMAERRALLESALSGARPPVHLTPVTSDRAVAERWFARFEGAGLDGVIAKPSDDPYVEDRRVQFKLKQKRTADAVVAGFRWHKDGAGVGSLLLGLFDDAGRLHHVGVAASFSVKQRAELVEQLAPYRVGAIEGHPWQEWAEASAHEAGRMPGGLSRWSQGKDLSWEPLRPELVAEVAYSSMLSGRFRATTKLQRWRPDREPASCRYDQLEAPALIPLDEVLDPPER
ncbi:MAG: ATP-dependent DNA ligase [Acidimicrobiia bacterium]|nr:ATP-dependent DNA ligase [Acidimicrobiia bacterium]